jgi:hypothetical protein
VLLRTANKKAHAEFGKLSFGLSSEQYAAIFEEITAQTHTAFVFHSGCSTFTPTFARGRQKKAAHRGFSFGARKC